MRRLCLREGSFRDESGAPVYLVGANFWPKRTGPWMYRDPWDAASVSHDLTQLASLGANAVRLFCFIPDFVPTPDVVSPQPLERLASTVDLAAQAGLWSIPSFLVGHMSGDNWAPEWGKERNWYTDPLLLDTSELLVRTVVQHFAADARIAAWLLTNEWPLFAGRTTDEIGLRWATRLCRAIRAVDPDAPVSLGDGSWDVIGGERSGLPSRELGAVVDFYGPHFYPKETDALRHSAFASFAMRMLEPLGKPVLLEEFGCSSDQADDSSAAAYYRTVLWSAYGAGNCGTLFWNSHDFAMADRPPYSHHPYELHFGVFRFDGSRKPQADEVERFARFALRQNADEWELSGPHVAVGRSSYYLTDFPFAWGWTRPELRDVFLQTYASLLRAGRDAGFVDLGSVLPASVSSLFVPCLQALTAQDADSLERFAREGGTLYLSHGGEPWHPGLEALIGARPLIRYGLVQEAPPELQLTFARDFADLRKGSSLRFVVRGDPRRRAWLACEPQGAEVVAVDQAGAPALLEHRPGPGRVVFMTYPIEYYALGGIDANASDETWRLYRAITHLAGGNQKFAEKAVPTPVEGTLVQKFSWRSKSDPKRHRVLLVNHGWTAERVTLETPGEVTDAETGERLSSHTLTLYPKAVRTFDLTQGERG